MDYEINHRDHKAHRGRTTETNIAQEQICYSFQVLIIGKIARLCELCASVVSNRSCIIKIQACESAKSSLWMPSISNQKHKGFRLLEYQV